MSPDLEVALSARVSGPAETPSWRPPLRSSGGVRWLAALEECAEADSEPLPRQQVEASSVRAVCAPTWGASLAPCDSRAT